MPEPPFLTHADTIVLENLLQDVESPRPCEKAENEKESSVTADEATIELLDDLNNEASDKFETTVFSTWDAEHYSELPKAVNELLLQPYIKWAERVARRPTDVIFVTHIIIYLCTAVPSAVYLYRNFNYIHGVLHWLMIGYYAGPFTLLLHNHIHNNGILSKGWVLFDKTFPYVLEPLMGHTWDSYWSHHCKMHHVEGNGPNDLSSTIRYQRDEFTEFLKYLGRFFFLIWIELPLYFYRTGKTKLAIRAFVEELTSYALIYGMASWRFHPTLFVFILPLVQMRIALMVGNFAQHAIVDMDDPKSDFRSSITLIDVPSNRFCFNDGYHTSHHLNPRRHWRDHPASFIKAKDRYKKEGALVFRNIDYLMMTVTLLKKDYVHLAKCLVPIGDQIGMTQQEIADMLRSKTKKFTEEEIQKKFA